jgi:hypothetical protein
MAAKKAMSAEESLAAFDKMIGNARGALDAAAAAVAPMRGRTVAAHVASKAIDDAARHLRSALSAADDQLFFLLMDIGPGLE